MYSYSNELIERISVSVSIPTMREQCNSEAITYFSIMLIILS